MIIIIKKYNHTAHITKSTEAYSVQTAYVHVKAPVLEIT